MNSKRNYALEIKMFMKTDLKKESRWTMLKALKANKTQAYLNREANNKLKRRKHPEKPH